METSPTDLSPIDEDASQSRRLRSMFKMSLAGSIAGSALAAMLGALIWYQHGDNSGLMFALYMLLIGVGRVFIALTFRRADDIDSDPGSWEMAAMATMLASGLGWGAAAYLFFTAEPFVTATLVSGMGLSGLLLLAPSARVSLAFNAPLFAGLLVALLLTGGIPAWTLTAMLVVLIVALGSHAKHVRDDIRANLELSNDRSRLAQSVTNATRQMDEMSRAVEVERDKRARIEEQLHAAKISAEAANMAKDEFLATMSHEIRTPLNGILPILDILRGTDLDENQKDYLRTAFQSSKHLLTIIDDILDYSKIEAGKLDLETVGINLRDLLDSVVRLMQGSASKKGVTLVTDIDKGVRLAMRGDPVRLRQVLTNLVSNAIKFTDRGTVTVSIAKRQDFRAESELLFTVRDTGIGMDKATADRLFKPFAQADASTTRTYGGTGLGLAICKRLVELMGGRIGVKSQLKKGSVFWFTVRLKKSLGDIEGGGDVITLSGSQALLVTADDSLAQRWEIFTNRWEARTTRTATIEDGRSKLRNAAKMGGGWQIHNLIVDAGGELDIRSLINEVRSNPALSDTGILLLNADGEVPAEFRQYDGITARMRSSSESSLRDSLETLLAGGGAAGADEDIERTLAYDADVDNQTLSGKVLLVEDNPVNLHVAQKLLSVIGLNFDVAKNGKLAFDALAANHASYDAVLMDCMMPVLDGYGATRHWREREKDKELDRTPIIAMTANAMAGDREKCLAAGMDDYMAKPMNRALLVRVLGKWMGVPGSPDSQNLTPTASEPATAEIAAVGQVPARDDIAVSAPVTLSASPSASIDAAVLSDLVDIMGEDFDDLVRVYLEDTPKALRQLAKAAETRHVEALIGPSHSLKSTSANLGAITLSELAREMETDARNGAVDNIARRVGMMVREYKQVATQLRSGTQ